MNLIISEEIVELTFRQGNNKRRSSKGSGNAMDQIDLVME